MPATPQDRLYGLTTSVAVKPPVFISADYDITCFGEQTITSKTPTDERTITTTEGMRILLLGQDNPVENGIWVARRSFWVRAPDFNGSRDAVNGTLVFSITGDCWQVEANDPVVIGLSVIHFRPTYPFEANLDIFQRTLRVPEASVSVLPSAEDRAWKGLGFDGAGQPKLQDPAGTGLWGYVPAIGSFEKGSIITERFQVLLWEATNEYWRWDGSPFPPKIVLPGSTPDTAGGRGKGKWLDVTDATLRSNLGSSEGFGLVGKCPNISTLRTIEPSYSGQSIILEKCDADGVLLNVQLHHDPYDIFSPDDGFSVFVTPGGARWKPDLTHGYNVALAGLKRDLSNLADCFDRVRDSIINRIKANGRVNNILCKIMIPSVSFVTNYKIDHPLVYPSIITLTALGNVYIEPKEGMHFQPVVAGDNSQFTNKLTKAMFQADSGWQGAKSKYLNQASARVILDCVGGVFTIRGPGYALEYTNDDKGDPIFDANGNPTMDTTGLSIGNMAPCDLDCRDVVVQNVSVIGFNKSFVWGTYNTFICGLRNVYFSRVYDAVTVPDGISNSGERMWYDNVTFANVARHAFVGKSAGEHTLYNSSVDFVGKDLFYNGPNSACSFVFQSGHIEGVQRYIASKEAPTSYSKASVYISESVKYDPRRGANDYRGITQMFSAPTNPDHPEYGIGLFIDFNAHISAFDGVAPNAEYPCYAGSPVNTGFDLRMKQRRAPGSRYLNTYGPGSKLVHATIQPAEADVGHPVNSADPLSTGSLFAAIISGGAVVEYGAAADQNDAIRVIKITLSATTDTVQLFLCNRARAVSGRNPLWASCSVNVEGANGQVNLTPIMANYQGSEVEVNTNVIPTKYLVKPKLAAITQGYPTDMIAMKAKANRTEKFQAMPSSTVLGYWQGSDFFIPGFLISGYTGVMILKVPSFWFETENGGY